MPQPLTEPALLVTVNCPECRGCGTDEQKGITCDVCEGSGRQVDEMPMSAAWEMVRKQHEQTVAEPPSMVRDRAVDESG